MAILIASPGEGANLLAGPPLDIHKMRAFLLSPLGGAWTDDEIVEPPLSEVALTAAIEDGNERDYLFLVYSGHGARLNNGNTRLALSPGQTAIVEDLLGQITTRATLVVDTCRAPLQAPYPVIQLAEWEELLVENADYSQVYRAFFEAEFMKIPQGVTTLFACRPGQTATDTPAGAVFLNCLLNEATLWASRQNSTRKKSLSVGAAWLMAGKVMEMMGLNQQPSMLPLFDYSPKAPLAVWLP
jgi:hypothetical protein